MDLFNYIKIYHLLINYIITKKGNSNEPPMKKARMF